MGIRSGLRSATVVAACVAACPSQAAVVYRCRAADGALAFRDAPCRLGETQVDRREFAEPVPPAASARGSGRRVADAHPRERAASAHPPPPALPRGRARPDRIVAHECRFGEQRWVQAEACPRSLAAASPRSGKPGARPVQETRLTESQVCGVLRQVSAADAPGEGSARRSYGMNRLRQRHGC